MRSDVNPGQLDLNLLNALNALLQERHVTRAAQKCGLSEPAMSRALGRLRHLFGDEILVRVGREYHLTSFSEELVGPVHDIVELIDDTLTRRPSFVPAKDCRQFTIAASDYAAFLVLRPLSARVTAEAPGVSLRVRPLAMNTFADLEGGHLDLAFRRQGLDPALPSEPVLTDRWVCAVWARHPDIRDEITLEEYFRLPHLSYSLGAGNTSDWPLSDVSHAHQNSVMIESYFMLPFFLPETRLVAIVPERIGQELADFTDVRLLDPPFAVPPVQLAMYWHPRSNQDPAHVWLRESIQEVCRAIRGC
jgi:DNA-binding transcriptional LysR family regulator